MPVRIIHGKKYRTIPLEMPDVPTTMLCGVEEYPEDEREEKRRRGPSRHYSRKVPDREILTDLYVNKKMSLREISRVSFRYLGDNMHHTKLAVWLKKYGVKLRRVGPRRKG